MAHSAKSSHRNLTFRELVDYSSGDLHCGHHVHLEATGSASANLIEAAEQFLLSLFELKKIRRAHRQASGLFFVCSFNPKQNKIKVLNQQIMQVSKC